MIDHKDTVMIHIFECGHVWRNNDVPDKCPICVLEAENKHLQELIYEQGLKVKEYESNPTIQHNKELQAGNAALLKEEVGLRKIAEAAHLIYKEKLEPFIFTELNKKYSYRRLYNALTNAGYGSEYLAQARAGEK